MIFQYRITIFLLSLVYALGAVSFVSATIIHVPGQMTTIKSGISVAEEGDTIMVSAGTYYGPGNRDLDFGGKAVVVKSMKGATLTVINCEGSESSRHRGFQVHQGEDSASVIEGFTIINGYAPYNGPGETSMGGGILCQRGSSPTIKNCVLYGNYAAGAGGGLACVEGSSPRVIGCTIVDNSAIGSASLFFVGYGGGIRCQGGSSPEFIDCIVTSNRANIGGGISCNNSQPRFENCEFSDNVADVLTTFEPASPGIGGGMHLYLSTVIMSHCVFDRNMALSGMNMDFESAVGGGIASYDSHLELENCTIYGNTAEKYYGGFPGKGAGIFVYQSPLRVENSIIAYNNGGEAVGCPWGTCGDTVVMPEFYCTDIFGNELGDWTDSLAMQEGINGNFSSAPFFCDPGIGNLYLWSASPCSPDSNECGVLIGAFDVECLTDVDDFDSPEPETLLLSQNRPNPFNQSTVIEYALPQAAQVKISVYNSLGQVVATLLDEFQSAGPHRLSWNGTGADGVEVASGIYFYTIHSNSIRESKRMVLLK